jgi:GTP cyclohydrolase II
MTIPVDLPEPLAKLLGPMEDHLEQTNHPWVTLAYAQSLDGSITAQRGTPLELSGLASLMITHRLRAQHQAILIGIGTLLADDPQLNVRLIPGDDPKPVVLDNQLRFPLTARLLQDKRSPWIITSSQASLEKETLLIQAGARLTRLSPEQAKLCDVLKVLGQEGIRSVMVEGGARIITAFLIAHLVNAVVITISPKLVGGLHAVEEMLMSRNDLKDSSQSFPRIDQLGLQRIEDDLLVWGRPCWDSKQEQ